MSVIEIASQQFEQLDDPGDWSVAHQKLAPGYLHAGDARKALHHIEIALSNRREDSPLQQVRVDTAYGHILGSDPRTRDAGLRTLGEAEQTATRYGLSHQLRSIKQIRRTIEEPS